MRCVPWSNTASFSTPRMPWTSSRWGMPCWCLAADGRRCRALAAGEELASACCARMCNALLGARWHPRRVQFTHKAPPDPSVHRRVFGCAVEFGREFNALVLRGADLEQPNSERRSGDGTFARRYVDSLRGASKDHSVVLEVRKAIYLMLPAGRATIEQVAHGMGVNVRTLQRQLEDAGVTFSGLLRRGAQRAGAALPRESGSSRWRASRSCSATACRARSRAGSARSSAWRRSPGAGL